MAEFVSGKVALDNIAKALDGVTEGPWRHTTYMSGTQNVEYPGQAGVCTVNQIADRFAVAVAYETSDRRVLHLTHRPKDKGHDFDNERYANGQYIAACSPEKMADVIAYVASLEAELTALKPV